MHEWLCIWRTSGGKYHVEGFNRREDASRLLAEVRRKPGVIDALITRT